MITRPSIDKFPPFYRGYVAHLEGKSLIDSLNESSAAFENRIEKIQDSNSLYRYSPDKWSIRGVLQHIIDAERIFCFRALVFAREDKTRLPGFDEVIYAIKSKADDRNWEDLKNEFRVLRQSTLSLFKSFDLDALKQVGTANEVEISVECIGFIISGHLDHHLNIIQSRYLKHE